MRACLVTEWILALLATKQAHPESVTLDEVGPLMGLLYAFPRDERVQSAGAEALALIAMDEGDSATVSAEDLVEEGAITVLKEAMRNHRKNMHLQEQAGSCLLHMASRSADVAIEIQQAGGTKAIAAAIKLHPVRAARGRCALGSPAAHGAGRLAATSLFVSLHGRAAAAEERAVAWTRHRGVDVCLCVSAAAPALHLAPAGKASWSMLHRTFRPLRNACSPHTSAQAR